MLGIDQGSQSAARNAGPWGEGVRGEAPPPHPPPLAAGGRALGAFLLALVVWGAFVYAQTYPSIKLAWSRPSFPPIPSGLHWHSAWLALPLCLALFAAAHGLGRRILRALQPDGVGEAEAQAISIPVGLVPIALGLFTLACLGLLRRPWMVGLCTCALLIGLRDLRASFALLRARATRPSSLAIVAGSLLAIQWAMAAVTTMAPDLFFDAPHYHLYPVTTYLRAGGFTTVPGYVPLHLPELAHLLFAFTYDLAGNAGSRAVSLLAGAHVVAFVGWAAGHLAGRRAGWLAALLLGSTPVFVSTATATMPDLVLAVFAVPGLWIAIRHGGMRRGAAAAGLLAGGAAATKIVGCVLGATIVALCAAAAMKSCARSRRTRGENELVSVVRPAAMSASIAAVSAAIVALPFLIKNWIAIGNPLFPALGAIFGHHVLTGDEVRWLTAFYFSRFGMGRDATAMLLLPWNLTVHGGKFSGCLGAFFLSAVPLLLLALRDRRLRAMCAAIGLSFLAMATSQHVVRYFFPGLALLCVALAVVIERLSEGGASGVWARRLFFATAVATATLHLPFFHGAWLRAWFPYEMEEIPLANAAGVESDDAYLTRRFSSCRPLAARHRGAWGDMRILGLPPFIETPATWFEGHLINSFVGARIAARLAVALHPADISSTLRSEGFTHVLVDGSLPLGDPFSEESVFSAEYLDPVDAAGTCTLYALRPPARLHRTVADLQARAEARPGGLPEGVLARPVVRAGVDSRAALVVIAPHEISIPVAVPPEGASMEGAVAMALAGGDGAVAVLFWEEQGHRTELLRVPLRPVTRLDDPRESWLPVTVDLEKFAGRQGAIVLATAPGPNGDATADWVGWGWPKVTSRGSSAAR